MKPHEEQWEVVGCGSPAHGPEWKCWKVKNAEGRAVLSGANKATAQRYAAFPAMARALLEQGYTDHHPGSSVEEWHTELCWEHAGPPGPCLPGCASARAALKEAGVLE
jgi:hypothetical protein